MKNLKKLCRELLSNNPSAAVTEILEKYGNSAKEIEIPGCYSQNHRIVSFVIRRGAFLRIWWQDGQDSGYASVSFEEVLRRVKQNGRVLIDVLSISTPSVRLCITSEELGYAMNLLSEYIAPDKVFRREQYRVSGAVKSVLRRKLDMAYLDEAFKRYANKRNSFCLQCYHNARMSVLAFVAHEQDKYIAMPVAELSSIIGKVFRNNEKPDFLIKRDADGKPIYNLDT